MKATTILMILLILAAPISSAPALVLESGSFAQEELDQMLAPIALYPDS